MPNERDPDRLWQKGTVLRRAGSVNYYVLVDGWEHKRHANQLRRDYTTDEPLLQPWTQPINPKFFDSLNGLGKEDTADAKPVEPVLDETPADTRRSVRFRQPPLRFSPRFTGEHVLHRGVQVRSILKKGEVLRSDATQQRVSFEFEY